jgi:hypothetical protein
MKELLGQANACLARWMCGADFGVERVLKLGAVETTMLIAGDVWRNGCALGHS